MNDNELEKPENLIKDALVYIFQIVLFVGGGWILLLVIVPPVYNLAGTHFGKCVEVKQIVQIGGCNFRGVCGVAFHDRTIGEAKKPVRGQMECVRKSF
jgi:hypothetical protein